MADTLYLDPPLLDRVERFSKQDQSQVLETLERLNTDPIGNSQPMSFQTDGLRVANSGNIRIVLSHDPDENLTVITDIVANPSLVPMSAEAA